MVAWLIYWGRKWVEKSHASYFLERRYAAQNKLHAKAPFPVCQNLFWQVCGSIIIDCQISINDLISVCVRVQSQRPSCPAAERKAAENVFLQNRPLSQLSTHLIHMVRATIMHVCNYLCINVFHAYMNILSIYSCMNPHMPDSYLNDHTGAGEVSCTFLLYHE